MVVCVLIYMLVILLYVVLTSVSLCVVSIFILLFFFFFKQKTAYEMRISDWSSDVCSSDLRRLRRLPPQSAIRPRAPQKQRRPVTRGPHRCGQIGRASCRERVCQYV